MNIVIERPPRGTMISTWRMSYQGLTEAGKLLVSGSTLPEAILHSVKSVEDNEKYVSVGYGGLPNREGEVELDAAYMDGNTLEVGAVMAVKQIKNPIEVAYDLSNKKRSSVLVGTGAEMYARQRGFAFKNMLTESSFQRYLKERTLDKDEEKRTAYEGHDTVCVIWRSGEHIACGVSTSGLYMKYPGRIGDSPLVGSGFYADSSAGAAAATGVGEDIMKGCLSFAITEKIRAGVAVQEACEQCLLQHLRRLETLGYGNGGMSVIAMDKEGNTGAATTLSAFPFVISDGKECKIYIASRNQENGEHKIFIPDSQWLERCSAD